MMKLAHRSPSIMAGAAVLPALMFGHADMSACPNINAGNTAAPAMMLGDRCAGFILNRMAEERLVA